MSGTLARFGKKKRHEMDMTVGSIMGNLFAFALPLLVGNLFQQLYNMVDTWVIGQTGQDAAYAAVGSVGPIINIMIGIFSGLASGAGVVISRYFGAKEQGGVTRAVHSALIMTAAFAVLFTALGVLLTPTALRLMLGSADSEIYRHAKIYLTIYFGGIAGLLFYNMGAGILRAVGDSRHPFYFLLASAITNIVLDLVFVFAFGMGVAGVAWATVISQMLAAVLTVITLIRTDTCVKVTWQNMKMDREVFKVILAIGFPAAIQMALTAFSNVFVQSYIAGVNLDQTAALGGWTSYSKIDQFLFLPSQSLALAVTTFVGQNLGAGNAERARRGIRTAILMAATVTAPIILLVMAAAPHLAAVFNPNPEIVDCATLLLHWLTPFYIFTCVNQLLAAGLRGAGNSTAPMVIMLSSFVGFRQLYLYIMSNFISNDLLPVAMGYPAGWAVCCIVITTYYALYKFRPMDKASGEESEATA